VSTSARDAARPGRFAPAPGRGGKRPLLTVAELSAYHGELRALFDVSFHVVPGEILSIIGANGAGKSTLLKSIVGMMSRGKAAHIEGVIDFRGRRLDRLGTEKIVEAGVTMVPEGRRLFPRLSVEDNLLAGAFPARCRKNARQRLDEVYALFPRLSERRDQVVSQMSGGEQQMVAIGRALMSSPELVLFDELSLGLAPAVVDDVYANVRRINGQGVTCIVIEQDMKRALAVASHVLVMLEGRVVLEGAPGALTEAEVTAAYFGTSPERRRA
jgi:branched-chain amino acid transport system ATP-binding protein